MTHRCEHSLSDEGVACSFGFFENGHSVHHEHDLRVSSTVGDGAATLTEVTHRSWYNVVIVVHKSLGNIIKEGSVYGVNPIAEKFLSVHVATDYQHCTCCKDCRFHGKLPTKSFNKVQEHDLQDEP